MKLDIPGLKQLANKAFDDHKPFMSLYQDIADNFYPERADFTFSRGVGRDYAAHLTESTPVLIRRDLGDSLSSMLRDGHWFDVGVNREADQLGNMWLQWATKRFRDLLYNPRSGFTRATKEADHDFVTFGPAVISCEKNRNGDGLLFRNWHLRDCSWWDDESGLVSGVVRKWQPTYLEAAKFFPKTLHKDVLEARGKDALKTCDIVHISMPADQYGDEEIMSRYKYVSIYIDRKHDTLLEAVGKNYKCYVVPRFKTIAGCQFAFSPATTIGLPDARSLQDIRATLMDAAERYASPPVLATEQALRSDIDLSANGITYIDADYDEKLGAALRTLQQDRGGWPIGNAVREQQVEVLRSAFYSNKLAILQDDKNRTAYEVDQLVKQYRRENLPLFEPIEMEYNGQLCELGFDVAFSAGFFGSVYDVPPSLRGSDIKFQFKTPLTVSDEERKMQQFNGAIDMATRARDIDPAAVANLNIDRALRDAMSGAGYPEDWKRTEDDVILVRKMQADAEMAQQAIETQRQAGAR